MSGCTCRHAHLCEPGRSCNGKIRCCKNPFPSTCWSDKGFRHLERHSLCETELLLLPHVSTSSAKCSATFFTDEQRQSHPSCFTLLTTFDLCASGLCIAQGPLTHERLQRHPGASSTCSKCAARSTAVHRLTVAPEDQITPVILSLDAFVSGTCP